MLKTVRKEWNVLRCKICRYVIELSTDSDYAQMNSLVATAHWFTAISNYVLTNQNRAISNRYYTRSDSKFFSSHDFL